MQYDKEILEKTGIFVFNNAVSPQLCEDTINFFENSKNVDRGKTFSGYNPHIKNSLDLHIYDKYLVDRFTKILFLAHKSVLEKHHVLKDYPIVYSDLQMQKSIKDKGYFKPHIDCTLGVIEEDRVLAPIFYLNDVSEGGETNFINQKFKIKPTMGSLIIFPATFEYLHEGVPPKSNDKYIITTFGIIKNIM